MLAAAIAALAFLPARARLTAFAARFVYGAREAPDEALRTFGSRMTRAVAMDELLLQLAESLRKTMGLTRAEIYTGTGDVLERAVSVPDADRTSIVLTDRERPVVARAGVSGNAWAAIWLPGLLQGREHAQLRVAPVSHAGELLGLIVVERPERADAFTDEDDRVLTELARQAGLAFHNAQLDSALQTTLDALRQQAEELRESRARIVASGDAERRRVERNLHDGAQQHLVALAISLRLTKDIVAEDPAGAAEMLGQMAEDVQATIKELRELAHGIYPPLLADNGLGDALRATAGRSPLAVYVTVADEVGRYPAEVEAAIYFSCTEALQNAAKHAQGATVQLRLWTEAGGLLFSVADDGPGFDAAVARRGHGYVNMADRLGAIGGTVRWDSRPATAPWSAGRSRWPALTRRPVTAGEDPGIPVLPQPPQRVGAEPLLVQVAAGPAGRRVRRQVADVVGRAQEHHHLGVGRHDLPGRLDAVHPGHVDVHQHQLRMQLLDQRDGLGSAGGLPGQLEAVQAAQYGLGREAERRLVIDHEDKMRAGHALSLAQAAGPAAGCCHPPRWWGQPPRPPLPCPRNISTALTRRFTSCSSLRPSLAKIEFVCFSTARSDTDTAVAMAALFLPWAISARICVSRGVSVSRLRGGRVRARPDQLVHHQRIDHRAAAATVCTARTSSSTLATRSFSR